MMRLMPKSRRKCSVNVTHPLARPNIMNRMADRIEIILLGTYFMTNAPAISPTQSAAISPKVEPRKTLKGSSG